MRSAPGVAIAAHCPGIRFALTAWPASGDKVTPSDSYFGQVTTMPVMPVAVGSVPSVVGFAPLVALSSFLPIGHASFPLFGSFVPARLLLIGWLNMSYVIWPVKSPNSPVAAQ